MNRTIVNGRYHSIDDNLEAFKGKKWFSTLNLGTHYWQIIMSDMDIALASHVGLYKFLKMAYMLNQCSC